MQSIERQAIELGIIVAGPLDSADRRAVDGAISEVRRQLNQWLAEFDWQFQQVRRDEWTDKSRMEPTDLLQQAREERDEKGWDFAFVLTAVDLVSHYKPFALGIISRTLDVAVISTARIDPRAKHPNTQEEDRTEVMRECVLRLMLHTLGHWLGLGHDSDPNNTMHDIDSVDDLQGNLEFSSKQLAAMHEALQTIADQRLEERTDLQATWSFRFALLAAWENRFEILDAVTQAKPWEFPTRLSRLTTAAVSAVVVLLMTAETWDMAMSQSWLQVTGLFLFALITTTGYVATRQQLLIRRSGRAISEQIVASNVSASAIVASGMLVTFLILALLTLAAAVLLFPSAVVHGWAASAEKPITAYQYFLLAGTVGSLGIMIGALGASFEQQSHFRHVVFVDEEV
ncbi:MAG: hypothetical protein KDA87_08320 [Planctomycetales bacterium]|nr:hypothetical protein [Planctomycetales bacterium]